MVGNLCAPNNAISTKIPSYATVGMQAVIGAVGAYAMPLAPASLQSISRPIEVILLDDGDWEIYRSPVNFKYKEWITCVP